MRTKKANIEDLKKGKVVNPNPHSTICNPEPQPSLVLDTPNPQSQPVHSPATCSSPEKSSQDGDKSDLSESTSTTTNLNETCSLDTSCDHLSYLDSPNLSSELQDTSIVESTEPESVPDFEDLLQLDSTCVSSQDTSSIETGFFLILRNLWNVTNLHQQMFSVYNMTMTCPYSIKRLILHLTISIIRTLMQDQDDFLIHATNLSHNISLAQFMAQHNCEDLKPIDTPSTTSTFTQASSDHTSNPICAHNSMATQCNQAQYPSLLKQIVLITHLQIRLVKPTFPTL